MLYIKGQINQCVRDMMTMAGFVDRLMIIMKILVMERKSVKHLRDTNKRVSNIYIKYSYHYDNLYALEIY